MTMLAVTRLTIVAVSFHLRRATPRPAPSHPRSPAEKAPNPPRQKTGSVQIPIAPDAPPRHIFRGFLLWRFAYAGPRCAPRHLHAAGIRKPSQFRTHAPQQTTCTNRSDLLDHLVGAGEQRRRDFEIKRFD